MKKEEKNCWIKFVPSLDLPKERVSIAYDTHDERRVRYAYGYFQFHGGTCTMFWKDGNEQPKSVKAADILYWMPIPSFDSIRDEPKLSNIERTAKDLKEVSKRYALRQVMASTDTQLTEQAYLSLRLFNGYDLASAHKDGAEWKEEQFENNRLKHCDSITKEQAELEQGFVDQHIEKFNRIPTFLDAIWYGMKVQIERIMASGTDVTVQVEAGNYPYIPQIELYDYDKDVPLAKEGDKYKVVLIKED